MAEEYRCRKCGCMFECPNFHIAMSREFCPDCLDPIADDVRNAEKEAYASYRAEGDSHWNAAEKAHEFANEVRRERVRRGR